MATLFYAVYANAGATAHGPVVNEGTVTIAGTNNESGVLDSAAAVQNEARSVRIFVDANCFVTWGANPVAVNDGSDGRPMTAESWEYVQIPANHKLSVISRA